LNDFTLAKLEIKNGKLENDINKKGAFRPIHKTSENRRLKVSAMELLGCL
jgi:hypothetical protein